MLATNFRRGLKRLRVVPQGQTPQEVHYGYDGATEESEVEARVRGWSELLS